MNSLKSYVDENIVVGSIRQQLRHPSGADKVWIIVEGETDQKLFSKLIDGPHVKFEFNPNGWGKIPLMKTVSELLKETNCILGIRDADFLHLKGKKESAENIFLTDFHDSEMMIISCDKAFYSVISEYESEENDAIIFREKLLRSIAFISGLRWINDSEGLELNFNGLGFGVFYDGQTVVLDEKKCLYKVMKRSPKKKMNISEEDVKSKIKDVSDLLNLCNGHDFQKAFALCVSCNSKRGVNDVEIGKAFRLAYRFEDFQKSDLYRQLREWSDAQEKVLFKNA
ncbi:DUF4435 domain-containing protein [Desulfonema ishimotonii]|uniref:DUF4435 domain-containing protein n=1 Tax=Desulfonema ishimotonii TaxID=45657 RepID=A0A401G4G8_9BACT|nr:DUF4435 domain-containing protein [Desulfonema ishimotonii]GBC64137.1 DUF4435 domain-containing protein [Desulfonema ishimotonii]